ncbi:hypothetical protein [Conexibacter sp. SYSU D00693]|uniref:hypothetical protein n=1 Tax=Conexibacter sp. SYSU D00693 TaxID=2812560 RepID=UPI00196B4DD1|nr:hypothetical protein [Conexibacter sp. SYSU D00693]
MAAGDDPPALSPRAAEILREIEEETRRRREGVEAPPDPPALPVPAAAPPTTVPEVLDDDRIVVLATELAREAQLAGRRIAALEDALAELEQLVGPPAPEAPSA